MKFTLDWLKEHLDTQASTQEIVTALTRLGLEVESVSDNAERYAPFTVAYVQKAEQHPNADRLRVCEVQTGSGTVQVVCGAPNARAGIKVVFAPPGSFIPGTGVTLQKGVIRGQDSNGMMVSEREMGLSDEHTGIIEVADDVPLGASFAELYGLNDTVIDISLTPNRGDCAGVRGIARDLAAAGLGTLKPLDTSAVPTSFDTPQRVSIDAGTLSGCPLFVGRLIRGVRNGPSPDWLQRRLKAVGLKPISALVDVTNYLTHDLCRPLHVYDAARLRGNIHVRPADAGETLDALNGKSYALRPEDIAICDDSGALGLGGVIGGTPSGCAEDTTDVFLECALFEPIRIARTGRAHQIDSDARYRFERGVDPASTLWGIEVATRLILGLCGGEAGTLVTAGSLPAPRPALSYDPASVRKLAGFDIAPDAQTRILHALGFTVGGGAGSAWSVSIPSWRPDIEGQADLVEEILRVQGYDTIPAVPVRKDGAEGLPAPAETEGASRRRKARIALAARGLQECVTWSFLPRAIAQIFGGGGSDLAIANPISADLDQMRPSLLPNLLQAAQRNADRGFGDAALFEVGPAFASAKLTGQTMVAAGLRHGGHGPRHWGSSATHRPVDAFDAKADALAVLEALGAPVANLQVTRDAPGWYHPGRSGCLRLGASVLARFGEVHPGVLDQLDVRGPVAAFEVMLDALPPQKSKGTTRPALALSVFQPVRRDFAFLVEDKVEAAALIRAARGADKALIVRAEIFDVYAGKGVPDGHKSVALSVTLQPADRTLTDAEIEGVATKIVDAVKKTTGGSLRG